MHPRPCWIARNRRCITKRAHPRAADDGCRDRRKKKSGLRSAFLFCATWRHSVTEWGSGESTGGVPGKGERSLVQSTGEKKAHDLSVWASIQFFKEEIGGDRCNFTAPHQIRPIYLANIRYTICLFLGVIALQAGISRCRPSRAVLRPISQSPRALPQPLPAPWACRESCISHRSWIRPNIALPWGRPRAPSG